MEKIIKEEIEKKGIPFEKHGRVLVWHDEFDGTELDREKWGFDRSMGGKDRIYDNGPEQFRIEDGKVHMLTRLSGDAEKPFILPEALATNRTMVFKHGYVEMCGRLPFRHGAWPSFWMQSATPFSKANYFSEIDILEGYSSPNQIGSTLHKWGKGKHSGLDVENKIIVDNWKYTFKNPENLNNEYHTYGFEWDEKFARFYVDDEMYASFPIDEEHDFDKKILPGMQGLHDFSYLLFNNEIFSRGGGWPVNGWNIQVGEEMPIHYYIDYVRLYQKDGEEIKYGPEINAAIEANGGKQFVYRED